MNATIAIPAADVMKGVTMTLTLKRYRWWQFRVAVGVFLITLAARIIGCKCTLDMEVKK